MIDSIRAARAAAPSVGASLSGKVMSTGYSQGGHASMAAQRDHASEFNVAAGAHLAGPYNLSGSLKLPDAIADFQFFVPYLVERPLPIRLRRRLPGQQKLPFENRLWIVPFRGRRNEAQQCRFWLGNQLSPGKACAPSVPHRGFVVRCH